VRNFKSAPIIKDEEEYERYIETLNERSEFFTYTVKKAFDLDPS
jgi:hypothetical protein